jgi:hypothetical protein
MRIVREFKRYLGSVAHLGEEQRRQYHEAIERGSSPLRAYIETRTAGESVEVRFAETAAAYRGVLAGMARLANPVLIRGNVDGAQLRVPAVREVVAHSPLELVSRPLLVDLDWLGLVFWPSWRPASEAEQVELAEAAAAVGAAAVGKERVVVCAHEHFFKGPDAARYSERVARAGLEQRTVPRYDPNPTWRCLMALLRRLPARVAVSYIFGHVHDPAAVMAAGAPVLRDPGGPGLRYRLYGLGWRGERGALGRGTRRGMAMLPVAVDEVALLEVARDRDPAWRVLPYAPGAGA